MNPQVTSTPTKQDLFRAMRTYLKVQKREDIRRDFAEGVKFVLPDLRTGEQVFNEDPIKIEQGRKSGKWLEVTWLLTCLK